MAWEVLVTWDSSTDLLEPGTKQGRKMTSQVLFTGDSSTELLEPATKQAGEGEGLGAAVHQGQQYRGAGACHQAGDEDGLLGAGYWGH